MDEKRVTEILSDLDSMQRRIREYRDEVLRDNISPDLKTFAIMAVGKLDSAESLVSSAGITLGVAYNINYRWSWSK